MMDVRHIGHDMRTSDVQEFVDSPSPVLLEIGCNDGTDTDSFLKLFPNCTIYCFEPDPRAIKRFKCAARASRIARTVLTEAAVSNRDGTATFNGSSGRPPRASRTPGALACCYLEERDLSGSLCKPTGHLDFSPWTTFPEDRRYEVETIRLDTWHAQHPEITCIDFIWCDVQGAEAMVIEGAPHALARTRYFYTEFYDKPLYEGQLPLTELRKLLPGFELQATYGDNALFKNRGLTCPKSLS